MEVDRQVRGSGVVGGGFNIGDCAPWREVWDVFRDIRPDLSAVERNMYESVVGPGPNHALFHGRFRDRKENGDVCGPGVVQCEPARALLFELVVGREVRAQYLPALATVHRHVDVLATHVDAFVIVRRNVDRKGPLEAVSEITRGPPLGIGRPHAHAAGQPQPVIVAREAPVVTPGPHDVGLHWVGYREPGLAASHGLPLADGNSPRCERIAGAHLCTTVLAVSVYGIRDSCVRVHVVHLCDGEPGAPPTHSPIGGDTHP